MFRKSAAFLLLISLIPSLSTADFTFVDPTTNCQTTDVNGRAIYCCDGKCYDGTSIQDSTGQCSGFNNACYDPPSVARCATNQVYSNTKDDTVDAGLGNCYIGNECQWVRDIYTYSCCDCPEGFTAYHSSCDGPQGRYISFCVGCDGAGESLSYDGNGGYSCAVGPGTTLTPSSTTTAAPASSGLCGVANTLSTAVSYLGDASTLYGLICKFGDPVEDVVALAGFAISTINTAASPGADNDLSSNKYGLLLAAGVAGAVLLGLPEEIGGAAFLALAESEFALFCGAASFLGLGFGVISNQLRQFEGKNCPTTKLRRWPEDISDAGPLSPCTASVNPCAQLVAIFPTDYDIASNAQNACNDILHVDASAITDADLQSTATSLQSTCRSITDFTFLINFENFLKALSAAVPYCETTPAEESTLSYHSPASSQSTKSTSTHSTTTKSASTTKHTSSHFTTTKSASTKKPTSHSTTTKPPHTTKTKSYSTTTKSTHTTKRKSTHTTKSKSIPTKSSKSTHHAPTTEIKENYTSHHTKEAKTSCL